MRSRPRLAFALALVVCFGCDQASKQVAQSLLTDTTGLSLAGDVVRFQLAFNPGGFMGLGAALPEAVRSVLLVWLVPSALALLCFHFMRTPRTTRGEWIALGLLAGGGLGNWLDRILNAGAVTDFVSLGLGRLRTGIFNVADVAVIGGALLLALSARRPLPEPTTE
jgi:signal peptidase II